MTPIHHVIATDRPRYHWLPGYLGQRLDPDHAFTLIDTAADLAAERLEALQPRYVFLPHWSTRIPPDIHDRHECVIFHMTDLPYGRGGSPLQNLIVRGHHETRLSALRCTAELDAGPVYRKRPLALDGSAETILQRAGTIIAEMIEWIVTHEPAPEAQQGEPVHFRRRTPADSDLAPVADLAGWYDHIRMLDAAGYPPARLDVGGFRLEFSEAEHDGDSVTARVRIRRREED